MVCLLRTLLNTEHFSMILLEIKILVMIDRKRNREMLFLYSIDLFQLVLMQ